MLVLIALIALVLALAGDNVFAEPGLELGGEGRVLGEHARSERLLDGEGNGGVHVA